jgi:ribosomal protein S12 methylthiotransferase accessory factor
VSVAVSVKYVGGTHRACPPEQTLRRIMPAAAAAGVTRLADITGLDRIGLPVFAAVRPRGEILQASNGKGLRPVDARVSALMEAIEQWHCEQDPGGAAAAVSREPDAAERIEPRQLPLFLPPAEPAWSMMQWVRGMELVSGQPAWLPAPAVYANELPRAFAFSTNGLASGNTLEEATLHGLYEVIERDVVTRHIRAGLSLRPPRAERVRPESVGGAAAIPLRAMVEARLQPCLVRLSHSVNVHVFWAALLDPEPFHPCTRVTFGYGAHLSPDVAAVRALTEAAQARLSYIHGVREDLEQRIRAAAHDRVLPVFRYFDSLPATLDWAGLQDYSRATLSDDLQALLQETVASGYPQVLRAELTRGEPGIPVVRVIVPGAAVDRRFF